MVVRNLRSSDEEWLRWRRVAAPDPFSVWARRLLNAECDQLEAEARRVAASKEERARVAAVKRGEFVDEIMTGPSPMSPDAERRAEELRRQSRRELPVKPLAVRKARVGMCPHRVPVGQFCKRCD